METVGAGYELAASEDPEIRNLVVASHPETGEPINRFFVTPTSAEDLRNRTRLIHTQMRRTGGLPSGILPWGSS